MKANETKLRPVVEGTVQYLVPLFQRPYSWTDKHWRTLLDDLEALCEEDRERSHFMGSIVTAPVPSGPEQVVKYLLIDGQQRITTLFILFTALRDSARKLGLRLADEVQDKYLTNEYSEGDDHLKLLPTQGDRDAFRDMINRTTVEGAPGAQPGDPAESALTRAHRFFLHRLRDWTGERLGLLKRAMVDQLSVVSIALDAADNPHVIFESLNYKGQPLTQADLIRNYFFMRLPANAQEPLFHGKWRPMQERLGDDMTEFVRHDLMRNGSLVRKDAVYHELKERAERSGDDAAGLLSTLSQSARLYARLTKPDREEAEEALSTAMQRLNRLAVTVAYPFLLNVYDRMEAGSLTVAEVTAGIRQIENYVLRRWVCNVPTHGLNKVFLALTTQVDAAMGEGRAFVQTLGEVLSTKNCPSDAEFCDALKQARLYGGNRLEKARFILESLERARAHKEAVPLDAAVSVEHVMPRTLTAWWQEHLGEEGEAEHEALLDTLGNLTLTAYNSELSNRPFPDKRTRYAASHLELNRGLALTERWDGEAIRTRGAALAVEALAIWPALSPSQPRRAPGHAEVTGTVPTRVMVAGRGYGVDSWRSVAKATAEAYAEHDPERFREAAARFPTTIIPPGARSTDLSIPHPLPNGYIIEIHGSADRLHRWCRQLCQEMGLAHGDWSVETTPRGPAGAGERL